MSNNKVTETEILSKHSITVLETSLEGTAWALPAETLHLVMLVFECSGTRKCRTNI